MGWLLDKARSVVDAIIQEHVAASARLFRRISPQLLPFARPIPAMRAVGPGEPVHRATFLRVLVLAIRGSCSFVHAVDRVISASPIGGTRGESPLMPMSRARTESGLIAVRSRIAANISVPNADVQARSHVVDPSTSDRVALLVERAKRGDRDAFGELYRACYAPLYRVARFHLGAAAEDVVAETFLRAWAGIERYRDTGAPFIAWLHGIARHVVADELARRRRVEPRAEPPEHSSELSVDEQLTLAQAMDRLPQEQRQVLELKFLVGLTNSEVAAALGKTTGAVNTKQWRALEALRQTLGER